MKLWLKQFCLKKLMKTLEWLSCYSCYINGDTKRVMGPGYSIERSKQQ